MTRRQKQGVILILIGLALPLVALALTSPAVGQGFEKFWYLQVVLAGGKYTLDSRCGASPRTQSDSELRLFGRTDFELRMARWDREAEWNRCERNWTDDPRRIHPVSIQYSHVFAVGVIALFVGIGMVVLGREFNGPSSSPPS